ncbi:MAG: PQQ-binding-like beta-propeller repeat protein [Planctomycetota bacterium]|nr:PQQ-binding-like beta-propeller repeat protein [Planctomycetota bacterium]
MRVRIPLLIGILLAAGAVANAGDWTHWRGPEQNGVSREKGLVDDWSLESKKNVLWVSPIGGRATPIVMHGRIYLDCRTPDDVADPEQVVNAQEQVVCRDANTGDVIWKDVFDVFQTDIPAPRVGWASLVGDPETGYVYLHSVSGLFRCYTPDGKVVWEYSLHEEFGKVSGYGGRTVTPIIDEDRVIVSFFGVSWAEGALPPPKQTYYAFDKPTTTSSRVSSVDPARAVSLQTDCATEGTNRERT